MAGTSPNRPENLELTGEYLSAMETVSSLLMNRLPGGDELWRILGQTEALLLEAQMTGTPLSTLFGKGGVAGFCQSIIDEKSGSDKENTAPAITDKASKKKPRSTTNRQTKKRKNLITAAVVVAWLIIVTLLVGQYTGFLPYLRDPYGFYRSELHNFDVEVTELADSRVTVTLPITAHTPDRQVLYQSDDFQVTLTYVGFDEDSYTENDPLRRFWVELTYTQISDFSEIAYVSPAETGTVTVTLADGQVLTQELHWKSDGYYGDTAFVRLYFLEVPKNTVVTADGQAEITFDPMSLVRWTRTGIGIRAK